MLDDVGLSLNLLRIFVQQMMLASFEQAFTVSSNKMKMRVDDSNR